MMKIIIPTAFRKHADGQRVIQVDGVCVADGLKALIELHPDLRTSLYDDSGELVPYVGFFVGDRNIQDLDGTDTKIADHDELLLVPAIAGG